MTRGFPDASLDGRRLLITGAGSGIGRALLEGSIDRGARCAALVRDEAEAGSLASLLPPDRIHAADFAAPETAAPAARRAVESLGGALDGFAACAGIFDHRAAGDTGLDDWRRVLDVNLTAAFETARVAAGAMAAGGSIVLVSSQIGLVGHPRAAAYAASKAGLNGLVRALALEHAPRGVRVNAVAPGPVATPMTAVARRDPDRSARLLASIPLGRFGEPGEIAAAIAFLLSDAAGFVTGAILAADGGVTAA